MKFIKNKINYFLAFALILKQGSAFSNPFENLKLKHVLGVTTIASTAAACYEYYKNRKITKELDAFQAHDRKLNNLKNSINNLLNLNNQIQLSLGNILNIYNQQFSEPQAFIDEVINQTFSLVNKRSKNLKTFKNLVRASINDFSNAKNDLALKLSEARSIGLSNEILQNVQTATEMADVQIKHLTSYYSFLDYHDKFLTLLILLQKDFNNVYKFEIGNYQNAANANEFLENLDRKIKTSYSSSNVQLPYLAYVEKIKQDISELEKVMNSGFVDPTIYQKAIIDSAFYILEVLSNTHKLVVNSQKYLDEKSKKPELDRLQERFEIEMQEKQSKIENEKKIAESHLIREQNTAQELENHRKEIEHANIAMNLREREITLELAKIHDGKNVSAAVHAALSQSNKDWEKRLSDYKKESAIQSLQISQERLQFVKDKNELIESLRRKNDKIQSLENKISQSISQVGGIADQAMRLPVNPESVDGLTDYLNNLISKLDQLKRNLNS